MYADDLLQPWFDAVRPPGLELVDPRTHVGAADPSGYRASLEDLLDGLARVGPARACAFPLKDPGGYAGPNLELCAAARDSGGRLTAFARLDPGDSPDARALAALDAGARGLKLHPDGEGFPVDDPRLERTWALADEQRLPVIVHAGPELLAVGPAILRIAERFAGARIVLAHGALPDLSWIWHEIPRLPNLFVDTSWWGPSHILTLLALLPPGRILSASDVPYSSPLSGAHVTLRCLHHLGAGDDVVGSVMGGQAARLVAGEAPLPDGEPLGDHRPVGPLLERLVGILHGALQPLLGEGPEPTTAIDLARLACRVPDDDPDAPVMRSVHRLLALYETAAAREIASPRLPGWDVLHAALVVARTPGAPLPPE